MPNLKKVKIVVFTPSAHGNIVRETMAKAGAGIIGSYSDCSFSIKGIGRFKPLEGAHPHTGKIGKLSEIEMERIEMVCPTEKVEMVINEMKKVHPYEEPGEEIYPLLEMK